MRQRQKKKGHNFAQGEVKIGKNKEIQEKKENRRSIRSGTIIAILAILGTICAVLYKMTRNVIGIWPEKGNIYYYYAWILLLVPLGATVQILIEIVLFITEDVKRYNILDEQYEKYDEMSDKKYYSIISDFNFFMVFIAFIVLLCIPVALFMYEGYFKYVYIGVCIMLCVVGIHSLILKKRVLINNIILIIKKVLCLMLTCFVTYVFIILSLANKTANLEVNYQDDGTVVINNRSNENFGSLTISVYSDTEGLISEDSIQKQELLFAKELKHLTTKNDIGKEIGSARVYGGETLYWKYQYRIGKLDLKSGTHIILITIRQDDRRVEIMNEFKISNGKYIYGQDLIEKKY